MTSLGAFVGPVATSHARIAVATYAVVGGAMVARALATGAAHHAPALVVGALLVAGSDLAGARERFATRGLVHQAIGLPNYDLGQTLVALALVTA